MELSEPEQGIGYQEVLYFIFAVIEDFGSPFGMLSQTGIGMFKNALTSNSAKPWASVAKCAGTQSRITPTRPCAVR